MPDFFGIIEKYDLSEEFSFAKKRGFIADIEAFKRAHDRSGLMVAFNEPVQFGYGQADGAHISPTIPSHGTLYAGARVYGTCDYNENKNCCVITQLKLYA